MGSLRVKHDGASSLSLFTFMLWGRKWQPTPVFLPGESQGRGAWWAAAYGVTQSQTQLKRLSSGSSRCLTSESYMFFRKHKHFQGKNWRGGFGDKNQNIKAWHSELVKILRPEMSLVSCFSSGTNANGKELACQCRLDVKDTGSIPGWGRSPRGGNGSPLQYSSLGSPMDRGAWWAIVHRIAKESDRT